MACENPIPGWLPARGGRVRFSKQRPADGHAYSAVLIPCGQCILCKTQYAQHWQTRILHEAQMHADNAFITLTYDDRNLPEYGELHYEHLVTFWKRVRFYLSEKQKKSGIAEPLRYYAVGEYGDESLRPHYHACVFGQAFTDRMVVIREHPSRLWTSAQLEMWWGLGQVSVGALTSETAAYVASYVTKKLNSKQQYVRIDEDTGELVPLAQPRAFMSRNIGKTWWEQYGYQVHDLDLVYVDGKRRKPPRAYDKWLEATDSKKLEKIKNRRRKKAKRENQEQRHARARNAHARARLKKKTV